MKKIIIGILLLSFFQVIYGQDDTPELVLPSANAFEMTKYGNATINESTGKISTSIPLYDFEVGKLNVPISLNYTGNGVKVDQLCSWTGINWNLNAGGVITRIVRDRPDGRSFQCGKRILLSQGELAEMSPIDKSLNAKYLNEIEMTKSYDTEADLFSFSFPGYSGSFYLDEELNPVLANYEFKLDIIKTKTGPEGSIDEFLIISPEGAYYYFGDQNAIEQTLMNPNTNDAVLVTTAYYLTRIEHPNGEIIYFDYDPEPNAYFVRLYQSQHISKVLVMINPHTCEYPEDNVNCYSPILHVNKIFNGKYLRRIRSNRLNTLIEFDSDESSSPEYKRILNGVTITEANKKKNISFNYSFNSISNSQRFFLTKVTISGSNNTLKPIEYRMEYNDPTSLPDRFSFSQDHLGYFNGKSTNTNLLPKNNSTYFKYLNSQLADRDPVFEYASKGALKKIYYPTGGYTEYEYESPQVKQLAIKTVSLNTYCSFESFIPDTKLEDDYLIARQIDELENPIGSLMEQTINVNVAVSADPNVNTHYKIYVKVKDLERNTIETKYFVLAPDITTYNKVLSFNLLAEHRYTVKLELEPNPESELDPWPVYVNAYFDYTSGNENIDGLGLRIKRTFDYPNETAEPITKRYYYKKADELSSEFESNVSVTDWNSYSYVDKYVSCCVVPDYTVPEFGVMNKQHVDFRIAHLQSNTIYSLFPSNDNVWHYDHVTISYGGDDFKNGGVQKDFIVMSPGYAFPASFDEETYSSLPHIQNLRENTDMYNDILEREIYIEKSSDGLLYKKKEIEYKYRGENRSYITSTIFDRVFDVCSFELTNYETVKGLYIGMYRTFSKTFRIDTVITKDFIDAVSVDVHDDSPYKKIISKKVYKYGYYVGLPTEILNSSSNIDKVLKTKIYYPHQGLGLDGLSQEEKNNYTALYGLHILSTPIQVENYIGNYFTRPEYNDTKNFDTIIERKISTQRTIYGSNHLPQKIQSSFGDNPLEDKIYFNKYDTSSNPLEIVKANNISTVYIWGYNQTQLIAKIENYSYSNISENINQLIENAKIASNSDIDFESENSLRTALSAIRNAIPEAMVTSYTYDLPYGVSSITDANGVTSYYKYDDFGRLKSVQDEQYRMLKEYTIRYQSGSIESFTGYRKITVVQSQFGEISISKESVKVGESCSVNIIPINGYHVENLVINEELKGSVTNYTIEDIRINQNIEVLYDINKYSISGQVIDQNGNALSGVRVTLNSGEYTTTGTTGLYSLVVEHGWSGSINVSKTGYTFTNQLKTFTNVISDISNQNFNGTIITFTISGKVLDFEFVGISGAILSISPEQSFTTTATGDYSFTVPYGWSGNVTISKIGYTFTPSQFSYLAHDVISNISNQNSIGTINTYTISGIVKNQNGIALPDAIVNLSSGQSITTSSTGMYSFTVNYGWTGTVSVIKAGLTFASLQYNSPGVITNQLNKDFVGAVSTYTISGQVKDQNGTPISGASILLYENMIAEQSYTTTESGLYSFNVAYGMTGKVTVSKTGYTFPIYQYMFTSGVYSDQTNKDFTGNLKTYTITATKTGSGTMTPSGNTTVNYNSGVTYSFAASSGYYLKDVKVNGTSVGAVSSYTFSNVTANKTLSVEFAINTYTITATKTGMGTMTPSGNSTVNFGSGITYTFTPSTGSHIKNVKVNGTSIGVVTSYSFTNVTSNQTISVEFEKNTYTIYASKTGSGTMTPSGNTTLNYYSDITYSFTPASGYHIKDVLVDEISVGAVTSYSFGHVASNHILEVEFAINDYLTVNSSQLIFDLPAGTQSFSISSNVGWTITKNVSWITVTPISGSNNATITINCTRLNFGERTGTITISGGGITKTVSVYQGNYAQ